MDKVNSAYEYLDEEGLKETADDVLIATEDMLDSYITQSINEDSIPYEIPSSAAIHRKTQELLDLLQVLLDTHQNYTENDIYRLLQLACIVKGDIMPIPTDKIVVGTGSIDEIVTKDTTEDPIRDDREGIRYRYYFVRETENDPYALYKYEDGEWRVIGHTKDTLKQYWHKTLEKTEIEDRILEMCYVLPDERLTEIIHTSWNRFHEID